MRAAKTLLRDRHASVAVLVALIFPILVAIAGLVTEYGSVQLLKVKLQRVTDAAAYSGALAYNATGNSDGIPGAVSRMAVLNGVASEALVGTLTASPTGSGSNAVYVTGSITVPLTLTKVLDSRSQVTLHASAYAELKSGASNGIPCIMALNAAGTGVTLSGGGAIAANGCAISTNNTITVPNGTSVTTPVLTYNSTGAPSATTLANIHPPTGVASVNITKRGVADPLAANSAVTSATSRLTTVALMSSPSGPTVSSGTSVEFGYSTSPPLPLPGGCTGAFNSSSSNTWTVTCSGAGPFNFGNITMRGGITAIINNATTATYNFSGSISNSGTSLSFNGPGTYNIAQGLTTSGGTTTTFAAGTFNIGVGSATCSGAGGKYSICHNGSVLTFGGPSTFVLSAGLYNTGGAAMTFGSGSANSYRIGPSTNGNAVLAGGGSALKFADATGAGSLFQMSGKLNISSGGGSCLTLPAASDHDINGSLATAGGTILGAGTYTVNGYVGLGANGGGDVTCGGVSVGLSGSGVTFVISAVSTIASGTCAGTAFCLGAGYGHVTLTAPSSGTLKNLVVIGPTTSTNTAGATFAEGATGTSLSGAFYIPYGPFTMSGAATVGDGSGQCLEVIASQVTLTGGTAMASTCVGLGGPSLMPGTIALVQ